MAYGGFIKELALFFYRGIFDMFITCPPFGMTRGLDGVSEFFGIDLGKFRTKKKNQA
jgi:hypothetical protein